MPRATVGTSSSSFWLSFGHTIVSMPPPRGEDLLLEPPIAAPGPQVISPVIATVRGRPSREGGEDRRRHGDAARAVLRMVPPERAVQVSCEDLVLDAV